MKDFYHAAWACLSVLCWLGTTGAQEVTVEQAEGAMRKAVHFFRTEVSVDGGYLWQYSENLQFREGEREASATTAWVQPPGTPAVGEAFLVAYRATGDSYYLDAALETAAALMQGQLESGGWDYRIEFGPQRSRYAYLAEAARQHIVAEQEISAWAASKRNTTTLDDNTTQAAVQFLMHVDQASEFSQPPLGEAIHYALNRLQQAQYPNGAWPQRYSEPPDPEPYPIRPANYPPTWSREHPDENYRGYYTFNDNTLSDMIVTMLEAERIYGDEMYGRAARRAGDFILLAQMPEPQPAWAQQYNAEMHPAWARRFEPPAITGGESQGVLRILMFLYRETGDAKYLQPIPSALAYLNRSLLPDGQLARFYELRTNRPLFFTKEYQLTYSDDDLPTHYSFKVGSRLDSLQSAYQRLLKDDQLAESHEPPRMTDSLVQRARRVIDQQDERGAWVKKGRLKNYGTPVTGVISCRDFIANLETLSQFLAASPK